MNTSTAADRNVGSSTGKGTGQIPAWAVLLNASLPRTTVALLHLDHAQRTKSPVAAGLRAAMRWVAAHANGCRYAEAYAAADARQAGVDSALIESLASEDYLGWTPAERAALKFARQMTVNSDAVTDEEFAELVRHFGDRQTASMVLGMAYANFQDRLLICLNVSVEVGGPYPSFDPSFAPDTLESKTTPPPPRKVQPEPKAGGHASGGADSLTASKTYEALQARIEAQRRKPTRLPIPTWERVARNLPEGLISQPSDMVWYKIVLGYAPELAVPFEYFMRTAGAETSAIWDRVFAQSLFWVTTQGMKCPYCMGHCEMVWEVSGLNQAEIEQRSRRLASDDWSSFEPAEQRAFAFARKLTHTPGAVSPEDLEDLRREFGDELTLAIALHASRHHYMTRISNGFQLTLERENPFFDYFNVPRAK